MKVLCIRVIMYKETRNRVMLFVLCQHTLQPMNLLLIVLGHLQMSRSWIKFIMQTLWRAKGRSYIAIANYIGYRVFHSYQSHQIGFHHPYSAVRKGSCVGPNKLILLFSLPIWPFFSAHNLHLFCFASYLFCFLCCW